LLAGVGLAMIGKVDAGNLLGELTWVLPVVKTSVYEAIGGQGAHEISMSKDKLCGLWFGGTIWLRTGFLQILAAFI
jgi:hypothetical protein